MSQWRQTNPNRQERLAQTRIKNPGKATHQENNAGTLHTGNNHPQIVDADLHKKACKSSNLIIKMSHFIRRLLRLKNSTWPLSLRCEGLREFCIDIHWRIIADLYILQHIHFLWKPLPLPLRNVEIVYRRSDSCPQGTCWSVAHEV